MSINYYVVGSMHYYDEDRHKEDMYYYMVSQNVVSMAWAGDVDLKPLLVLGRSPGEITNYLKNRGESIISYSSVNLFLSLKHNDMIAVKKWNMGKDGIGSIRVRAYAVVVR